MQIETFSLGALLAMLFPIRDKDVVIVFLRNVISDIFFFPHQR